MHANGNRSDAIYLVILGFMVSLLLGLGMEVASPTAMSDFKIIYYGDRCLIHHVDPYKYGAVTKQYIEEGNQIPSDPKKLLVFQGTMGWLIYPPTAFIYVLPLAFLSFQVAHIVWMVLVICGLAIAYCLAWDLGRGFAPQLSGLLVGLIAANNIQVLASGNFAGLVVSLCVISVWCFVRRRHEWLGVFCLAVSMDIKPHDPIWIWLILFLGLEYRKYAIRALMASVVLGAPALVWVWQIAPNWMAEMRYNIWAQALPGSPCDPNLAASGHYAIGQLITLQSFFSYFWNDKSFYYTATYLVFVPLFLIWTWVTLRSRLTLETTWLALAALLPLAMLPIYHRPYDAKLLMLAVPACALLWVEDRKIGAVALSLTTTELLLTGDIPWIALQVWGEHRFAPDSLAQRVLNFVWSIPIPLILLLTGAFYLWVYARRARGTMRNKHHDTESLVSVQGLS